MLRLFLGGTTKGWKWREYIKRKIEDDYPNISYFDPIVDDWNEEAQLKEVEEKKNCDFCLYVITPWISGVYSIAEAVEDACKRNSKAVFVILDRSDCIEGMIEERVKGINHEFNSTYAWDLEIPYYDREMFHSIAATSRLIERNGGTSLINIYELLDFLKHKNSLEK